MTLQIKRIIMNRKYILGLAFGVFLMTSCSEDTMDRINRDEANPSLEMIDAKFLITDAEVATSYSVINGNYAWYVSSYTEQEFGTGNNQLKNAEVRNFAEMASSTTFSNEWNATYLNLYNLKTIMDKCADGGTNSGQTDLLGMAQALTALNLGVLTDLHGDVPYSECFGDISAPKIDSQESIYNEIFSLLDKAQANFADGNKTIETQDILFGNDCEKWAAFVHALKARYLLHTYGVNKSVLSDVLKEADAAISGGFEGCNLDVFNGVSADNSWSAYHWSRCYVGSSKTVDDLMVSREDPREPFYNYNGMGGSMIGEPGNDSQAQLTETLNYPMWLDNGVAYQHLFSKAEIYFIRAEVKARLGQDAKADFEEGVKAAIEDVAKASDDAISDEDVTAYLANVSALFDANPLSEILVQKYLSQIRDEQIECYNDIRRCKYVDGSYPVAMTNPKNTQAGVNRWPLRIPYGESDVTSNPNVAAAFGSGSEGGKYIFTDPVWWAGGTSTAK